MLGFRTSASALLPSANQRAITETETYAKAWLSRAVEAQQGAGADNTRALLRIVGFPDPCTDRGTFEYFSNVDFDST
jgi:hypothetical protein